MKSLKSVLVVAFACAMLFAFTACEQKVPEIPSANHTVSEIQYVSGPTSYNETETFDPAAYEVMLIYKDNLNPQTVNGAMYLSLDPDEVKLDDTDSVRVPVKANIAGTDKTVFYVTYYAVEVELDITNASKTVPYNVGPNSDFSLEGAVATLVAADGTRSEYALSNLTAKYSNLTVTVTDANKHDVVLVDEGKEVAKYSVTKEAEPETVVTGVHVLYDVTRDGVEKPIAEDATSISDLTLYIGDEVTVTVYQTATKGDEDASAPLTAEGAFEHANNTVKYTSGVATIEVGDEAVSDTIYYYNEEVGETKTASVNVKKGENTVVTESSDGKVTLTPADTKPNAGTLAGGTDIKSYVSFVENKGLKDLDDDAKTTPSYSVYVDPARTYELNSTAPTSVNCFVTFNSYGKDVKLFTTVELTAKTTD